VQNTMSFESNVHKSTMGLRNSASDIKTHSVVRPGIPMAPSHVAPQLKNFRPHQDPIL
jgi:hypothetical protein